MASLTSKLICTGFLVTALVARFSFPFAEQFRAAGSPFFHSFSSSFSWLPGLYVYLVMNCVIVSIVASSKLQLRSYGDIEHSPGWETIPKTGEQENVSVYGDDRLELDAPEITVSTAVEAGGGEVPAAKSHKEEEEDDQEMNKTKEAEKPEGDESSEKPEETLDSMWQAIKEEQPCAPASHLRKSDTWESRMRRSDGAVARRMKMKKSETFSGEKPMHLRKSSMQARARKLKREESLSQEELNQRVETFINKFNEEFRLQRKKSMNNFKKMMMNVGRVGG